MSWRRKRADMSATQVRSGGRRRAALAAAVTIATAGAGILVGAPSAFAAACNQHGCAQVTGSMEGAMTIHPGDWVSGGYNFVLPGNNGKNMATVVGFDQTTVTIPVTCSGGSGGGNIVVPLGSPASPYASDPYNVPANFNNNVPMDLKNDGTTVNGSEASYGSYQGAVQAPDLCNGGGMNASGGAIFYAATVQWSVAPVSTLSLQFHYRDPAGKGKGNVNCASSTDNPDPGNAAVCGSSWSGTVAVTPDVNNTPVPVAGIAGGVIFVVAAGTALIVLQMRNRRRVNEKSAVG